MEYSQDFRKNFVIIFFRNIDNYSVHNTLNTKSNNSNKNAFHTEKINVNLNNIPKNNNESKYII